MCFLLTALTSLSLSMKPSVDSARLDPQGRSGTRVFCVRKATCFANGCLDKIKGRGGWRAKQPESYLCRDRSWSLLVAYFFREEAITRD